MSIEAFAEQETKRKDYTYHVSDNSYGGIWTAPSEAIDKKLNVKTEWPVRFLSIGITTWGGSCSGWLLDNLDVTVYEPWGFSLVGKEIPETDKLILLAKKLHVLQQEIPMFKNFLYLARTGVGNTGPAQTEQIKVLEQLGFERIEGSKMKNPNHRSELHIYGRLCK